MRPQGRKLALIPEWQKRRPDLGADFNPEWHSGTSVGTPDPRTPSATAAPSRAHSSANRAGQVVTSHTTSVTRSAQRAAPRHRAASLHHQQHPPSAHRAPPAPNAQPYERLPPSAIKQGNSRAHRALTTPITAAAHQSRHGKRPPRAHQERPTISAAAHQPHSPSAIRSASLSSAHRAASAPSVAFSAHQQRPPSGVSAQQAPSAAPTERQSPRPQQRPSAAPSRALSSAQPRPQQRPAAPSAAPTSPDTWSLATIRAPPGAPNDQRRPSPAALTERQRERQPQPHRSATAARQQHLPCARRITPLVAPSAQSHH
ncbi:predicted GPI-anchored protein 58 [Drosophila subpulchrella]|uniref:predicted GPI-anchored protein 58 n=1 Tax=Drosophila subpulchrella TaxID=1486046 RepID=UPI0018A166F6|nr:predicted GPI-anchored protein 58 [Drosophila subpulchrella]